MKAIRNYTSDMPINRIFDGIQKTLAENGARQITFDYGDDGKVYGIFFAIQVKNKQLKVKLPARVDKAQSVLQRLYENGLMRDSKTAAIFRRGRAEEMKDQAYRVAWKNIHDWVDSQMALLAIEMARIEEIFLPYVTNDQGLTFFELVDLNQYRLPRLEAAEEGKVVDNT